MGDPYKMPVTRVIADNSLKDLQFHRIQAPTFEVEFQESPMAHMIGRVSMDRTTKVDKSKLVAHLEENLAKHEEMYAESLEGWKAATQKWLEGRKKVLAEQTAAFEKGDITEISTGKLFVLPPEKPKNNKKAYKAALMMFEWSKEKTVKLSMEEFNAFVLDAWPWRRDTLMSNARYSKSATRALHMLDDE